MSKQSGYVFSNQKGLGYIPVHDIQDHEVLRSADEDVYSGGSTGGSTYEVMSFPTTQQPISQPISQPSAPTQPISQPISQPTSRPAQPISTTNRHIPGKEIAIQHNPNKRDGLFSGRAIGQAVSKLVRVEGNDLVIADNLKVDKKTAAVAGGAVGAGILLKILL